MLKHKDRTRRNIAYSDTKDLRVLYALPVQLWMDDRSRFLIALLLRIAVKGQYLMI